MSATEALDKFITAQAPIYETVIEELGAGKKCSHWMWFIFPQVAGLGHSPMAERYAIQSLAEAHAYLQHPLLGQRLRDCVERVLALEGKSAEEIFAYPDVLKFRSCLTLFNVVAGEETCFQKGLDKYYQGKPDTRTLLILAELDQ